MQNVIHNVEQTMNVKSDNNGEVGCRTPAILLLFRLPIKCNVCLLVLINIAGIKIQFRPLSATANPKSHEINTVK